MENSFLIFNAISTFILFLISILLLIVAKQQKQLQKFEKMFKIYISLKDFIFEVTYDICTDPHINPEKEIGNDFVKKVSEVLSILEYGEKMLTKYKELSSLLDEYSHHLSSLMMRYVHFKRAEKMDNKDEIKQNREELIEISDWFKNQREILDQKFEKYLRIE